MTPLPFITTTMSLSLSFYKLLTKARNLVPFLPPAPISPRMTKEQDASLLFSRLPPELRQMIWETYFRGHGQHGQHGVHIHRSRKRLRARECLEWDADGVIARGRHFDVCTQAKIICNHISLLLACKKMYTPCLICSRPSTNHLISYFECIDTLYRETFFDFSSAPRCITVMSKRLPATHIAHISRINLNLEFYHPLYLKPKNTGRREILWVDVWDALAAMEGLKWLRVELVFVWLQQVSEWTERESTLWEGIRKVTRPEHFELILPFPAAASTREATLPCTIIRRVISDLAF